MGLPSSHGVVRTSVVVARQQHLCADCNLFVTGLHAPGALSVCLLRAAPSSGACCLREKGRGRNAHHYFIFQTDFGCMATVSSPSRCAVVRSLSWLPSGLMLL